MSLNNIVVYPAKFEGYDDDTNQRLFTVEIFDEYTVKIKIDQVFSAESWAEASRKISNCMAQMFPDNEID